MFQRNRLFASLVWLLILIAPLGACTTFPLEPASLKGRWRAESFNLQGLKLPLGPELSITEHALAAGGETLGIDRIEQKDREVTAYLKSGLGLTFVFVNPDRMYFALPLIGYRIYYRRIAPAPTIL